MTPNNSADSDTTEREIVISRILNAPRDLVWEAWTNPERIVFSHGGGKQGGNQTLERYSAYVESLLQE